VARSPCPVRKVLVDPGLGQGGPWIRWVRARPIYPLLAAMFSAPRQPNSFFLRLDHLTDDQRAMIIDAAVEIQTKLAVKERASKGGKAGGIGRPKNSLVETSATKLSVYKPKTRIRAKIAKKAKVSLSATASNKLKASGRNHPKVSGETNAASPLKTDKPYKPPPGTPTWLVFDFRGPVGSVGIRPATEPHRLSAELRVQASRPSFIARKSY
jgi:hypothetical protein